MIFVAMMLGLQMLFIVFSTNEQFFIDITAHLIFWFKRKITSDIGHLILTASRYEDAWSWAFLVCICGNLHQPSLRLDLNPIVISLTEGINNLGAFSNLVTGSVVMLKYKLQLTSSQIAVLVML